MSSDMSEQNKGMNQASAQGGQPNRNDPDPGELEAYGDDETITDRVRTNLGRVLHADHLARLNINTQQNGIVYLRGPVHSQEESQQIEMIAQQTEGVQQVVNELRMEPLAGR